MMIPTVHLNGTSSERLVEHLCEASQAIAAAYEKLRQCAPNGRDFYPQGPHAMQAATLEHLSRLRRLDEVKKELDALALAICEADDKRNTVTQQREVHDAV